MWIFPSEIFQVILETLEIIRHEFAADIVEIVFLLQIQFIQVFFLSFRRGEIFCSLYKFSFRFCGEKHLNYMQRILLLISIEIATFPARFSLWNVQRNYLTL